VEQIVNNTVEAIENQKYNEHLGLTINALYKASNGILNLSYTYESDPNMKARINVQLKNINIQLDRYRTLIKGFRPEDIQTQIQTQIPQLQTQIPQIQTQIPQLQTQIPQLQTQVPQQNFQQAPQVSPQNVQVSQNNESPHSSSSISSPSSVIDLLDSTTSVDFERKRFKRPVKFKKSADKEL
jgi:TolA-binding protein